MLFPQASAWVTLFKGRAHIVQNGPWALWTLLGVPSQTAYQVTSNDNIYRRQVIWKKNKNRCVYVQKKLKLKGWANHGSSNKWWKNELFWGKIILILHFIHKFKRKVKKKSHKIEQMRWIFNLGMQRTFLSIKKILHHTNVIT